MLACTDLAPSRMFGNEMRFRIRCVFAASTFGGYVVVAAVGSLLVCVCSCPTGEAGGAAGFRAAMWRRRSGAADAREVLGVNGRFDRCWRVDRSQCVGFGGMVERRRSSHERGGLG